MGHWGLGPFENDAALDLTEEADTRGAAAFRDLLRDAAERDRDDGIDDDDGAAVIAAAAIVVASRRGPLPKMPRPVVDWLAAHPGAFDAEDEECARRALERVVAAGSEIRALYEEAGADALERELGGLMRTLGVVPSTSRDARRKAADAGIPPAILREILIGTLRGRGLTLEETERRRIDACDDVAELSRWLRRATEVNEISELFVVEGGAR
jgi:hypothetical protein